MIQTDKSGKKWKCTDCPATSETVEGAHPAQHRGRGRTFDPCMKDREKLFNLFLQPEEVLKQLPYVVGR
jgi:hypothetical protein